MPASRIFRFARTSRCASVGSGTRNARAISAVRQPADEAQSERDLRLRARAPGGSRRRSARGARPGISASSPSGCSSASRSSCSVLRPGCGRGGSGRSPVPRRGDDPGAGVRRDAFARPPLDRRSEGVLDRVLGEVEVAEDTAEDRDRPRELIPIGGRDGVDQLTSAWRITTGRTSILPVRALGIRAAHSIASSRDSASIR